MPRFWLGLAKNGRWDRGMGWHGPVRANCRMSMASLLCSAAQRLHQPRWSFLIMALHEDRRAAHIHMTWRWSDLASRTSLTSEPGRLAPHQDTFGGCLLNGRRRLIHCHAHSTYGG
ncbi:hypothetical protein N658DRAFT_112318 [Parathielavia hyrcaniae]|uniref:Uncharacterized protein n=1 Tax=Parathielavia hyrcaniae TaxID=113614 RepID=A0AAN6Q7Z3_9PEZI|nr:hypothetical protein N658DRAFT_112318 [Parathielavia hyrcaniae]